MNKRLIVAAGHGGGDPGAVGQGTTEAATTVDIVNKLADKLRADGQVEVVVVPHELGLVDSINWVNARYKNLEDGYCLEVHKNSGVGGHGVEVWFFSGDAASQDKAQRVLNGLASVTGLPNRGVKGDATNRYGRLGWIRDTNPWAGLAECGFITDGGDFLDPDKYAEGLKVGVLNLWDLKPVSKPAPVPTPPPATVNFRVFAGDKQIGAYNTESGAWNKYSAEHGTKIADKDGKDVTAYFVEKYRPPVPPAQDPVDTLAQRVGLLEVAVKYIQDFLASIFSGFKKG